jgi:ribose transport system substrate-binding protein
MHILFRIFSHQFRLVFISVFATCFVALGIAHAAQLQGIKDPQRAAYYKAFQGKEVVYVPVFMGLDLTEGWNALLENQAKALGYKYKVMNANFNTKAGTQILTSLIHAKHKPDVIVVQNPDVTSYTRLEKKAEKEGIYVIQMNMHSLYRSTGFVGGDAVRMGQLQAKSIVKHCGSDTDTSHEVLVLIGPTTSPWSVYLQTGYKDVLSKHPGIKIVSVQSTGNYDANKAKKITKITLQQHPHLCGIMGVWDITDSGTAAAIKEAGMKGKVWLSTSGGGSVANACSNIKDGNFDNYVSYDVPRQGKATNDLIRMALQFEEEGIKPGKTSTYLYTPLQLLTKQSIKQHPCWTIKRLKKYSRRY